LHISEFTSRKFMEQFIEKINALHPDIVLLPGDVLEGVGDTSGLGFYEKKLSEIQSRYGVFACPGNHEHYGGKLEDTPFFKNAHITMLTDADTIIGNGFRLSGLDWQDHDSIKVTQMFLRMQADTIPKILMRHGPNDFETNRWITPDVQVSGHTHNGQLWPLNLIISSLYELPWGYQIIGNCHVFVTCGAQGWGPPVRTGSYSEIMEIDLSFVKENK
jgi:predicted MPP superfamily phosphohydrolase